MKKAVVAIGALCILAFAGPHPKYFPVGLVDEKADVPSGVETEDAVEQQMEAEPAQIDNDTDPDADASE
ncbi:MAG: hypothetical protein LBT81_04250 [Helicobacteraceae bacterium]|jgi:hypothetical protein|nr:hypothetical protein [Helicobacteraceae bacterium]